MGLRHHLSRFEWHERVRTLSYTYSAIGIGLGISLLVGAVHWNTLNFWLTAAVAEVYGGTLFIFAFFTWGLSVIAGRHLGRKRRAP